MPNRADLFTVKNKQQIYFSDFTNNLDVNPITKNLAKITNEEDAKKLITNLVLTNKGERFFRPLLGTNLYNLLFEPADPVTAQAIQGAIEETINNNLKIILLHNVQVNPDYSNQLYNVVITFSLINSKSPVTVKLVLKRVR